MSIAYADHLNGNYVKREIAMKAHRWSAGVALLLGKEVRCQLATGNNTNVPPGTSFRDSCVVIIKKLRKPTKSRKTVMGELQ